MLGLSSWIWNSANGCITSASSYVFIFSYKVDFDNNKFIHALTCTYNEAPIHMNGGRVWLWASSSCWGLKRIGSRGLWAAQKSKARLVLSIARREVLNWRSWHVVATACGQSKWEHTLGSSRWLPSQDQGGTLQAREWTQGNASIMLLRLT